MNFLSKTLFKQILPQFLEIEGNALDVEQGLLKLAKGELKKDRINTALTTAGMQLTASSYDDMQISIPWFEFSSKAIRVSIERLTLQLRVVERQQTQQPGIPPSTQYTASKGVIKSYVTRIASNIEVNLKELRIAVEMPGQVGCWSLILNGLSVKNSNLYMQENSSIRKTIMLERAVIDRNGEQMLRMEGVSFCVDLDEAKIKLLTVVDKVAIEVGERTLQGLRMLRPIPMPGRQAASQSHNIPQEKTVNLYFKLEQCSIGCTVREGFSINVETRGLEIEGSKCHQLNGTSSSLRIMLRSMEMLHNGHNLVGLYSSVRNSTAGDFITSAEHDHKTVRDMELHFSMSSSAEGNSISLKLYQLGVDINPISISRALQQSRQQLETVFASLARRRQPVATESAPQREPEQPTAPKLAVELVVYKNSLVLLLEHSKLQLRWGLQGKWTSDDAYCRLLQLDAYHCNPDLKFAEVQGAQIIIKANQIVLLVQYVSLRAGMFLMSTFRRLGECAQSALAPLRKSIPSPKADQEAEAPSSSDKQEAVQSSPTLYVIVDEMYVSVGSFVVSNAQYSYLSLCCICVSQLGLKLHQKILDNATLKAEMIFIDQQSLVEERISNLVQIGYSTRDNNEKLLEFKNSLRVRLETRHLYALQKLMRNQPTTVVLSNHSKRTIRIVQPGYQVAVETNASCNWFVLNKSFRVFCGDAASEEIELAFEGGMDKSVRLSDRTQLVLRLVRLPNGQHNLLIRSCSYLLNCAYDLTIHHRGLGLSLSVPAQDFFGVDCEQLDQPIDKLQDFSQFSGLFSDSHLEELEVEWLSRRHRVQLMLQSEQKHYYSIKDEQDRQSGYFYVRVNDQDNQLFVVMPHLVVRNHTNLDLELTIAEKKTNAEFRDRLHGSSQLVPAPITAFDFYLKQFVVQVELESPSNNIDREMLESYASEQYYFSTFAFVSEPIERVIPLRNTAKQRYDKKHLCIKESVRLRTKVLELACGFRVATESVRNLLLTVRQRNLTLEPVRLVPRSEQLLPVWLRNDDVLIFTYEQAKVSVDFQNISYGRQIISFNFCKVGESFRNVLIMAELSREDHGHQTLLLQDFVTVTNLTRGNFIVDGVCLPPNQLMEMAIPPNLLNEFNNKPIKADASLEEIYKRLFSHQQRENMEEHSYMLRPEDSLESIDLYRFTRETTFEVTNPADKRVYRLLKDLSRRISFYIIEDVHSPDSHYTLVHNTTDRYFLLSQAPKFAGIFEQHPQTLPHQTASFKVLVQPDTSSVVLRRTDQSIFLCDSKGERLNELKSSLLDKMNVRCEKNSYGLLALVQFRKKSPLLNDQLRVKHCELILQHQGQQILSVVIKDLNVRRLEDNKYDLLLRELVVKDVRLNVPLFYLPEQTYLILECCSIHASVLLIRNMFLKIKRVVVDLRKELFVEFIRLSKSLMNPTIKEPSEPTKESLFLSFVRSPLVLVKNIFIDEFEIGLSLQMESIELKDQLQMPAYKLINAAFRQKKLLAEIEKFYSASIVAKFPKLSFIIQNVKHPFSSIRSLFSFRDSLRHRHQQQLAWRDVSIQVHSPEGLIKRGLLLLNQNESILACMRLPGDRRLLLTQRRLVTVKNQDISSIPLQKLSQVTLEARRDCLIAQLTILGEEGLLEVNLGRRSRFPLLVLLHSVIM